MGCEGRKPNTEHLLRARDVDQSFQSSFRAWKTKIEIQGCEDSQELRCQAYQKTEMARNQPELSVVSRWHGAKNLSSESAKEERSWVNTSGFPLGYLKMYLVFDGTKVLCPTLPIWKKLKVQPGLVQFLICNILHSNKNKICHETGLHETTSKNRQ